MSHAFISYRGEDLERVGLIARALEKAGVDVWWDRGLPNGESWHATIEEKLASAGCVVVIWSHGSVAPEGHFVRDEARRGLSRGILVPVLIDRIKLLPLGFGEAQAIDLVHWKGNSHDPYFQDLVDAVQAKLEDAPAPVPRGQMARVRRRIFYGGLSSAAVATLSVFGMNALGVTSKVCVMPGPQPGLSDTCGAMHLGARPSRDERVAWTARARGSCQALRDHINRFPEGAYRGEAHALIAARRVSYNDSWTPATRPLPLFWPAAGPPSPSRALAQVSALQRAQTDAERSCKGYGAGTLYRFVAATPQAESWSCSTGGGGTVCGFDGRVSCSLKVLTRTEQESCGPE